MKANTRESGRVSAIGPCDVLLGRGTGPNENQGNKMFRDILRKYKEAYRIAETKRDKRDIVATAIEEFKSVGGRFIERVVLPSHESSGKHCYEIVEGPAVSLKARQAFRYLLRGTEIDDGHKEGNPPKAKSSMIAPESPSLRHRLPTIHPSVEPTSNASLASRRAVLVPSQVEHGRSGELTSKDIMDIHRLASLVSEAPMLASLGTPSYYCPTAASPWRQHELIPLSFLPLRKMSDAASPSNPEMILNSMRYQESWASDPVNSHVAPRLVTNEMIRHHGQYPTISEMSQMVTRAKLLDSVMENLLSPTTTTDSLISTQYHRNLQSQQAEESSRIIEQRAVARALIEHRLRENRLAALVVPDLQRIMMMDNNETSRSGSASLRREVSLATADEGRNILAPNHPDRTTRG